MKTSTKIILLYISFMLAGMLTLYITTNNRPRSEPPKVEWKNKMMEPFSVVVTQDVKGCSISGDNNNIVSWTVQEEGGPKFLVRNDTLYVQNPKTFKGVTGQVRIQCISLRSVIANKGSNINLSGLKSGTFSLYVNGSEITINNWSDDTMKSSKVKIDLTVVAENLAKVNLRYIQIGKWDVKLSRSKLIADQAVPSQDLSLVLKDRSYAEFKNGPKNIALDRDSTSKVVIN